MEIGVHCEIFFNHHQKSFDCVQRKKTTHTQTFFLAQWAELECKKNHSEFAPSPQTIEINGKPCWLCMGLVGIE